MADKGYSPKAWARFKKATYKPVTKIHRRTAHVQGDVLRPPPPKAKEA